MKACRCCGERKPISDFYPHPGGALKRQPDCKECHRANMKIRRLTNPSVQEYDRKRAKTPARKAKARAVSIRWREQNPDAYRAQTKVGNAIRDGKLKRQPCALCGTENNVHAHHQDYSKPLDVKWLCAKCHHRIHATFPELGGHFRGAAR